MRISASMLTRPSLLHLLLGLALAVILVRVSNGKVPKVYKEKYPGACVPQCKRGHWYTLGIPAVQCTHEEAGEWLADKICQEVSFFTFLRFPIFISPPLPISTDIFTLSSFFFLFLRACL